ncbi:hypothetical protein SF1_13330 [Sphingobacterium faecium NBRC 15299]|nr:hypothetical protein SF1_13330 [Sphingobacterium faecium NBRC 15299]
MRLDIPLIISLIARGEFMIVLEDVVAVIPSKIPSADSMMNSASIKNSNM